nr:MAG TPA: hypothetical protein [Microviridae sp.]
MEFYNWCHQAQYLSSKVLGLFARTCARVDARTCARVFIILTCCSRSSRVRGKVENR